MKTMKPSSALSSSKIRNASYGYSVLCGDTGVAHPGNVVFHKRDNACVGEDHTATPALCCGIDHIFFVSTLNEVVGVYASRIITHMKNVSSFNYFSFVEKFKRKSMCQYFSAILSRPQKAIANPIFVGFPLPASFIAKWRKLVEESNVCWVSFSYHDLIMGNEIQKVKGVQ